MVGGGGEDVVVTEEVVVLSTSVVVVAAKVVGVAMVVEVGSADGPAHAAAAMANAMKLAGHHRDLIGRT